MSPENPDPAGQSSVPQQETSPLETMNVHDPQEFGRGVFRTLYRAVKTASIYSTEHEQTREAGKAMVHFLRESLQALQIETVTFYIRDEFIVVNGETLRLPRQIQRRLRELREIFGVCDIRGMELDNQLSSRRLFNFLSAVHTALETEEEGGLPDLDIPGLVLERGQPTRPISDALSDVSVEVYMAHLYIRLLVKVRNTHRQLEKHGETDVAMSSLQRITQTIAESYDDEDFTILRLPPMQLTSPSLASHSVNSTIYGMLLADRVGLPPRLVAYFGMALIYQDMDRILGVSVGSNPAGQAPAGADQFSANLRDIARVLQQMDDSLPSTLRALLIYERSCPVDQPLREPFYRKPRTLHLALRIADIVRNYDLLIQGFRGKKAHTPDRALDILRQNARGRFDHTLVELMTAALGLYPPGTTVRLSTDDTAMVLAPPRASTDLDRPVLRLIERQGRPTVDLSDPKYSRAHIQGGVDPSQRAEDPGDLFILK